MSFRRKRRKYPYYLVSPIFYSQFFVATTMWHTLIGGFSVAAFSKPCDSFKPLLHDGILRTDADMPKDEIQCDPLRLYCNLLVDEPSI